MACFSGSVELTSHTAWPPPRVTIQLQRTERHILTCSLPLGNLESFTTDGAGDTTIKGAVATDRFAFVVRGAGNLLFMDSGPFSSLDASVSGYGYQN